MTKISGGSLVARALAQEGVKCVFTIPGGHINAIYKGLEEEGIQLITTRHEQAAGNMAEGWAKTTGDPGVCLVTAGPGFVNLLPALVSAYHAHCPLVAITGHTALKHLDLMASQEIDQLPLVKPVTKYAKMVFDTGRISQYIQEAFRYATSGTMGPVLLDIPEDIQTLHWDDETDNPYYQLPPQNYRPRGKTYPDPSLVKKSAELLMKAEKPVFIAGGGVYWDKAAGNLLKVAELLSVPVTYSTYLGKGCIPDLHPLSIGPVAQNILIREADVIISLGVSFIELFGYGTDTTVYDPEVKVVFVNPDPALIGKNRPFEIGITSSIDTYLGELHKVLEKSPENDNLFSTWSKEVKENRLGLESMLSGPVDTDEIPIKPQRLTKEIQPFLKENTMLFLDGGDTTVWAQLILKSSFPGQIIMSQGPTGHLGAGLPMGIAAKIAKPERNVMVLTGDGSFLFNGVELDTAIRHDIPLVVIIENDSLWGMIAHNQDLAWGKRIGTILDDKKLIDYVKFAESFGARGELVTKPEDIHGAIDRAIKSNEVALVDVRIDGKETNILNQRAASRADPDFWK
ncbi:MAG: thiamine pyrophosphate-binding protein [Candidatus Hodarchaeales archaeon]|jgi:acetolactate synthase-1/2/3 large subunit